MAHISPLTITVWKVALADGSLSTASISGINAYWTACYIRLVIPSSDISYEIVRYWQNRMLLCLCCERTKPCGNLGRSNSMKWCWITLPFWSQAKCVIAKYRTCIIVYIQSSRAVSYNGHIRGYQRVGPLHAYLGFNNGGTIPSYIKSVVTYLCISELCFTV